MGCLRGDLARAAFPPLVHRAGTGKMGSRIEGGVRKRAGGQGGQAVGEIHRSALSRSLSLALSALVLVEISFV